MEKEFYIGKPLVVKKTVKKEPKWVVKIGKGYFSGYDETKVTYVLDNSPGEIAQRILYDDFNKAKSDADDIGGVVEEVTSCN